MTLPFMHSSMLTIVLLASSSVVAEAQTIPPAERSPSEIRTSALDSNGRDASRAILGVEFPQAGNERIHHDEEGGVHTAMGRTWKARFDESGATFIPFLGSRASRNYPITFRVVEVLHGSTAATFDSPAIDRSGERLTLDRGAVRAEYVFDHRGVEQLFVLPESLGPGGLTVTVDVTTELQAVADGAGWRFEGPEGGVRYGAAIAIDAEGRRLDLETTCDGDELQFCVPEHFVESAAWPIAIDPFISSTLIDTDPKDQLEVDVAFDPMTQRYLVVFQEAFSSTDADVKSWLVDINGILVSGSDLYISLGTRDTRRPRVACTPSQRSFLTVYTLHDAGGVPTVIRARSRDADSAVLGATFVIDQQTGVRRDHADVCGDSFSDPSTAYFTVVWQREWSATDSDIVMRICLPGGPLSPNEIDVSIVPGARDEQPSLCNSITAQSNESQLVYRRFDPTTGESQILGATIRFDGSLFIGPYVLSGATPGRYSNPSVSGIGRDLFGFSGGAIAVWEETVSPGDRDVIALAYSPLIGVGILNASRKFNLSAMEQVDVSLDQHSPAISVTGDRFLVSYASEHPGRNDYAIRATTASIVVDGIGLSEAHLGLETTTSEARSPKVASPWEYGSTLSGMNAPALTAFIRSQSPSSQGDVASALHTVHPFRAAGIQNEFCPGQANSTLVGSYLFAEYFSPNQSEVRLNAERLPPSVSGYFLASLVPGTGVTPPISSGTLCLGGAIGRYALSVLNSGSTGTFEFVIDLNAIRQPNGPVVGMMGETWYFQGWHRDGVAGVATSNFTNAVGVPIQ